jgi:hypothetical protein
VFLSASARPPPLERQSVAGDRGTDQAHSSPRTNASTLLDVGAASDPFTKKRLLALADRYDGQKATAVPSPGRAIARCSNASKDTRPLTQSLYRT